MAKDPKPNTKAYGSYTQMFLENEEKHFIDAERALPYNEVLSWGGRKHSEGMLPFGSTDYPSMDYLYPPTDLIPPFWPPDGPPFGPPTWDPGPGEDEDYPAYRFYCEIVCESLVRDCFNDDPVRCYYGAVTGDGDIDRWSVVSGPSAVTFSHGGEDVLVKPGATTWADLGGSSFDIEFEYRDSGHSKDTWFYHPLMDKWILILAGSSVCYDSTAFRCCPADEELAFDYDASGETIDPGGEVTLVITGGLPPYQWSVSGDGYSLKEEETWGLTNVLYAIDAECGVGLDPYAVVTVVDGCDESATHYGVRNTDGQWGAFSEVLDDTYAEKCDEKICDSSGGSGYKYEMANDADGIYGYLRYRYSWDNVNFPTCKQSDPDDCCGDYIPGAWNCGYSKNPSRGGLCNYFVSYGPAITAPITDRWGHDGCCHFELDEAIWTC